MDMKGRDAGKKNLEGPPADGLAAGIKPQASRAERVSATAIP